MDGSRNTLVSPVSIIPAANSKFSHSPGGLDENELCHDQINFSNMKSSQKSPSLTKHYMSPTISAASKAALPRKKVLAERNEVPIVEQILSAKPFHVSPKMRSPRCSTDGLISVRSCSSEPSIVDPKVSAKCLNQVRPLSAEPADDSSQKPYDPVTNYLSPRPQFLRYNPNRRHGISLHSENEAGEIGVGLDAKRGLSFDTQKPAFEDALGEATQGSSVSYSDDDSCKEEDEKTENENAEDDTQDSSVFSSEVDNEGSSVFSSEEEPVKGEYEKIFNENAENYPVHEKVEEEEEEEIEVYEDERGWSLKGVSQFLFVMVSLIFSTHYISTMNTPHLTFNPEAVWNLISQSHKYHFDMGSNFSESVVEHTSLWGKTEIGLMKFDQGEINDGFEEEFVIRDDNQSLVDITYELFDMEVEAQEVETDKLGLPNIEAEEEAHEDQVLESIGKASKLVEVFEKEKPEEVFNEQQESEAAEMYENENNSGLGSDGIERVEEISDQMVEEISDQVVEDDVERVRDTANNEVDKFDTGNVESGSKNQESDSMEFAAFPKAKLDSIQSAAIIVPLILTILASLGVVYYLRLKKVRIEESSPVVEPLVEEQPVLAENISPLPPTMEEEKSYGAENLASISSLIPEAQEEVAAEIRHSHSHSHSHGRSHSHSQPSHAPIVELLGELVIGEVSSSRRSYTVSSREQYNSMSVSQSQKESFMEAAAEVSSHHAKKKTTSLNLSAADSTILDGSSAAEKKKRSEGGAEGTPVRRSSKAALPSPSPVRRSSRLRDRSAMSP